MSCAKMAAECFSGIRLAWLCYEKIAKVLATVSEILLPAGLSAGSMPPPYFVYSVVKKLTDERQRSASPCQTSPLQVHGYGLEPSKQSKFGPNFQRLCMSVYTESFCFYVVAFRGQIKSNQINFNVMRQTHVKK